MYDRSACSIRSLLGRIRTAQLVLCAAALMIAVPAGARSAATPLETLHAMTRRAGVIFAGTITRVQRRHPAGNQAGVVEIEFAVQDAVRGVSGSTYVLGEWAGLWPAIHEPACGVSLHCQLDGCGVDSAVCGLVRRRFGPGPGPLLR